ncbi:MAG TPA: chemotaxis protein CheW [Sulfuricaulis sp.]|nr:chemotaxis protein CheW [Sulfuricaulis sp.]
MKKQRSGPRLHSLEVPLDGSTLLVPSASVAEVINMQKLAPVPFGEPWLHGAIGWRTLAVPVISIEMLFGAPAMTRIDAAKIVIFYPLSGRKDWEFFAVFATAEPRPQVLDGSQPVAKSSELLDSPYIAAGLKVDGRLMLIPDFEALKKAFYPA